MSEERKPIGSVGWFDVTIPNATELRDFYEAVVGWKPQSLSMGEYDDFVMLRPDGEAAAGVCHARGANAALPPQWLAYVIVADLDASIIACERGGGTVIVPQRKMGDTARFCVIRDPAGAVIGLYQQ